MSRARKTFSNEFKAKVALEAIKGYKSLNELATEYQVHPNAIGNWKKQALESFPEIFNNRRGPKAQVDTELSDQLYKQIGKQQVELDWLKKNLILSVDKKRGLIEPGNKHRSVQQQCSLIRLPRSSYYYHPLGITDEELEIMNLIDKTYTDCPFYGVRKITEQLKRQVSIYNHKRIYRLMQLMGIEAIRPR